MVSGLEESDMSETRTAQIVTDGTIQVVRLPEGIRFSGDEVYITQDAKTGDAFLSTRPAASAWSKLFAPFLKIEVPDEFMADRPMNEVPVDRNLFEERG
jgi:antitoxin VapB